MGKPQASKRARQRKSKLARVAHKRRAQKRKDAFGGLAAFCHTNPAGRANRPRIGRLG